MSTYDYSTEYLPVALSKPGNEVYDFPINLIYFADELPVMAKDISEATRKDTILSKVVEYTQNGWPNKVTDDKYLPYYRRRNELSADQGCLLWGMRGVIPPRFRERMLNELHDQHHGIVRMKGLARCYLWWPGLGADIEETIRDCTTCQSMRNMPPVAGTIASLGVAHTCWQRVHVDFAEKDKQMYLVLTDSHSKWIEVSPVTSTTSTKINKCILCSLIRTQSGQKYFQ